MGMMVSWMLVAAAVGAFSITALSGCVLIPLLHRLHFGQTIRESGPTWHNKKQGTPTMGGFCFILGILLSLVLVFVGFRRYAPDLVGSQQIQAVLLVLFLALGSGLIGFLATATAGACAGFLVWNFYPAKVFMGDTGSMFLGGIVTALAFVLCRPELVLFFGIVYIWDAMTVVIQRVYFKLTHGRRIFRMTPIHHAFEMRGWREVKIDAFFSLIALIGAAMGVLYIYLT